MDRRHLLQLLSGAALSGGLVGPSPVRGASIKRPEESIVIVGAGVSGLSAAERLRTAGAKHILLLEARDRVGGRVHTSHLWPDTPLDLGASWIHGIRGNPITRLAKEAGVTMVPTDYDDVDLFWADGRSFSRSDEKRVDRLYTKLSRVLDEAVDSNRSSLGEVIDSSFRGASDEDKALIDFLMHSMVETDLAEDSRHLDAGAWEFGKEFRGDDVWFPGGYLGVFAPRYTPFPIRTGQTVQSVTWGRNGVTLGTSEGDVAADRVILTLPLGVLQRGGIEFRPGLPPNKLKAMETLGMGCLNKVYLRFPEAFWSNDTQGFGYAGSSSGQWSQWLNHHYHHPSPVLLAFNAGTFARETEAWSDEDITAQAMQVLKKIHGNSIPNPTGVQITRWSSDPFSFGSYSSLRPGSNRTAVKALQRSLGRQVFFAGEATSLDYPSTVHGAFLSGQRAAEELLSAM